VTVEQQPEERPDDAAPAPSGGSLATTSAAPAASAPVRAWDNLWDYVAHGGHLADTRRRPRLPILHGEGYTVWRYEPIVASDPHRAPLLLVPPLGAPDFAFDLRRGASLVEDLLADGREVHVVTYTSTGPAAGRRGLELWVDEIVPAALFAVAARHDDAPVHLVGWSLGGLFALLAAASDVAGAPIRSVTAFASPVDVSAVPLVAPFRSVAEYTGGRIFSAAYRTLGSFPATAVKWAFQLTSVERYLTKPVTLLTHLDDRELLEQIEAVDVLMANMTAYPGRAFGQLYHHVIRSNDLAQDDLRLAGRPVRLAHVRVPVLLVAGADDVIAPVAAVERATALLTGSPDLRFVVRPGGHLGVLAGRRARENSWRDLEGFLAAHDGDGPDGAGSRPPA
jgi:polyhydroxyalkanoate synthase subunit PhaC